MIFHQNITISERFELIIHSPNKKNKLLVWPIQTLDSIRFISMKTRQMNQHIERTGAIAQFILMRFVCFRIEMN